MLQRALTMAMACLAISAPCRGSNLDAQLFPLTGEIRFHNGGASAVPLAFYSIASPSGALDGSSLVWKSITNNYDVNGNGFIDPTNAWTKISTVSTQLTEGAFSGATGSLPAFRTVSLGQIWTSTPSPDLTFSIFQPDAQQVTVTVQTALAGDYNLDHTVNQLDYTVWRQNFGSTTSLNADGNLNGQVDAADFVIWRKNFGLSIPGAGSGSLVSGGGSGLQVGGVVPEPTSAILLLSAAGALLTARARAPRAARRAAGCCAVRR